MWRVPPILSLITFTLACCLSSTLCTLSSPEEQKNLAVFQDEATTQATRRQHMITNKTVKALPALPFPFGGVTSPGVGVSPLPFPEPQKIAVTCRNVRRAAPKVGPNRPCEPRPCPFQKPTECGSGVSFTAVFLSATIVFRSAGVAMLPRFSGVINPIYWACSHLPFRTATYSIAFKRWATVSAASRRLRAKPNNFADASTAQTRKTTGECTPRTSRQAGFHLNRRTKTKNQRPEGNAQRAPATATTY